MIAIWKKEMRTYFTSMTGYVFLGFFVLLTGIFFGFANVDAMNGDYTQTLNATSIIFLVLIPMLTMRLFAEETRQKTDQLLYTSPVTITQIVLGKYLAAIVLFLIAMALTLTFPLILTSFGEVPFAQTAGSLAGYLLLGASFISVGIFLSSLTESQVIAAIATVAALFAFFMITSLAASMPTDRTSSAIFIAVLGSLVCFVLYDSTKNYIISLLFFVVVALCGATLFVLNPLLYDGVITKTLNWFSLLSRFDSFNVGILKISDIVYYLSFCIAFVYLTINTIEKRRWK